MLLVTINLQVLESGNHSTFRFHAVTWISSFSWLWRVKNNVNIGGNGLLDLQTNTLGFADVCDSQLQTLRAGYLYLIHCLHLSLLSFSVLCFWLLQNELAILEFIQLLVETMDRHFGNAASPLMPRMMSFYPMLNRWWTNIWLVISVAKVVSWFSFVTLR